MFSLAWLVTIEGSLLLIYLLTCAVQRLCRQSLAWNQNRAGFWSRRAVNCGELAANYARLALIARGERTRHFYHSNAAKMEREAHRSTTYGSRHEARARVWKALG